MNEVDISKLDENSKEVVHKMCELAKENAYLRKLIKDLTKLI